MNYCDNDAIYNPSTNPQDKGNVDVGNKTAAEHAKEYCAYGPPPRNYFVRRGYKSAKSNISLFYADHTIDNTTIGVSTGGSCDHPFSPAGFKAQPHPKILPEFTDTRPRYPGFLQPPVRYLPGQMMWKLQDTWQAAAAAALRAKGVKDPRNGELVTEATIGACHAWLKTKPSYTKEESNTLYHPADRGTAVFKDEVDLSMIVRQFGPSFSTVIVCPWIQADGSGWNRIYDTVNRPPVYTRYSTGDQGLYAPLLFGCLPKECIGPPSREWYHKEVFWFTIEPRPATPFDIYWSSAFRVYKSESDVQNLMKSLEFPTVFRPKAFMWCLVFIHRSICLGLSISNDQLGSWISQFGHHMKKCGNPHKPAPFVFDPSKPYKGQTTNYDEVGAWITNRSLSEHTLEFARCWDDAITARMDYNINKTDHNWTQFNKKLTAAKTPFW